MEAVVFDSPPLVVAALPQHKYLRKARYLRSQRDPVKKPLLARTVFLLDLRDSEIDFALSVSFLFAL
jgi:hypothetical protein